MAFTAAGGSGKIRKSLSGEMNFPKFLNEAARIDRSPAMIGYQA
jgi:hypothetical protein